MNTEWQITDAASLLGVEPVGTIANSVFHVGDPYQEQNQITNVGYVQTTWPSYWHTCCPTKSAREQVQDEILTKMAKAIESEDYKTARELVKLAKALKEL